MAWMDRRAFLTHAALGTAAMALPARLTAQPGPSARDRALLDLARDRIVWAGEAVWRSDVAAIADFGLHSAVPRLHICNLEAGTVRSLLVAHGSGSDPEHDGWLNAYSPLPDSLATSRGSYVTWEWYEGRFGVSMRLAGLEPDNASAFDRAIVLHAASYATADHAAKWGRLGRSNGCLALGPDDLSGALYQLGGGRLILADSLGLAEDGSRVIAPPQPPVDFVADIAQRRAAAGAAADEAGIPKGDILPEGSQI
jgi:hypothetical protein